MQSQAGGELRLRIGANHRLLFRLTAERLVVVDLIDRRDLEAGAAEIGGIGRRALGGGHWAEGIGRRALVGGY